MKQLKKSIATIIFEMELTDDNGNIITNNISAPVKYGDVVGKINVYEDGNYKYSVDITVSSDVDKANIFMIFLRNLKEYSCEWIVGKCECVDG